MVVLLTMTGLVGLDHYFSVRLETARAQQLSIEGLRADGSTLASRLTADFAEGRRAEALADVESLRADSTIVLAALFDTDGALLYASRPELLAALRPNRDTARARAILEEASERGEAIRVAGDDRYVLGVFPVPMPESTGSLEVGALVLAHDADMARSAAIAETRQETMLLLGLVLGFVALLIIFFHTHVTARLERLRAATARIGSGSSEVDPALQGNDEFASLSRAIAGMSRRIDASREAVEKQSLMYETLFKANPLPTFLVDAHTGRFLNVNDAAVSTYGYTHEEFSDLSVFDVGSASDRDGIEGRLRAIREGEATGSMGFRVHRKKGGDEILAEVTTELIEVEGRKLVLAVAHDVTERDHTERALRSRDRILQGVSRAAGALLTADSLDLGINSALATLGEATRANRAYLFESHVLEDGTEVVSQRASWAERSAYAVDPATLQQVPWHAGFERWRDRLSAGMPIVGATRELPESEQALLRDQAILSLAVVPVRHRGELWGFIGFDDCEQEREWSETEVEALKAAAGVVGAAIHRDRVLEEVRLHKSRLENAERIARVGHWHWDVVRDEVVLSDALNELYGLDPEEPPRSYETIMQVIHPDDRAKLHAAAAQALDSGGDFSLEYRVPRPDGSILHLYAIAQVHVEGGSVVRLSGTTQDVTEQVRSGEELRRLHEQLRTIAANVPGVVYRRVVATDGTVSYPYSSGSFYRRFGVSEEDVAADPEVLFRHVHDEDRAAFARDAALRVEGHQEYDFRVVDAHGEVRWVRSLSSGRELPDGSFVRDGIVLDITEQKALEEQLRQSQKLEAVGQLTGGIAHDFNNLLAIVMTSVDLLEMSQRDGGPLDTQAIEDIRVAAQSGSDLVKGLLGFGRRADLTLRRVDLGATVESMSKLLQRLFPSSIDYCLSIDEGVGTVYADTGALQQVVMNLAANARDAMPGGGTLQVAVTRASVPVEPSGRMRSGETADYGVITVSDTGIGMDEKILERAFEPFFTTKEPGKGTGLGLGVVHGLVRQQGGFTRVESTKGRGTTFRVYLPIVEGPAEPTRASATTRGNGSSEGRRILVVEDQPHLRRTTRTVLERLGYEVLTAANGREGAEIATDPDVGIDLIFTDLMMPEMTAVEMYQQVRAVRPSVPFVVSSGYVDKEIRDGNELPRDAEFLAKPWTIEELVAALDRVFGDAADEPDVAPVSHP